MYLYKIQCAKIMIKRQRAQEKLKVFSDYVKNDESFP